MNANQRFSLSMMALTAVVAGLMMGAIPRAQAQGIVPVNTNVFGNTYGEWSARWWQWVLSIPKATNPNLDKSGASCKQGQKDPGLPVFFLAGTFGSTFIRSCTVPAGKALFFPILNAIFGAAVFDCSPTKPGVPCNLADLRVKTAASLDPALVTMTATIDDTAVPNLNQQRVQSPVLTVTLPADNIVGVTGTNSQFNGYAPNVADGYWLMVSPLPTGNHKIHFTGAITGGDFKGFSADVTYNLLVQQE
jgi:hypothetical protein